jgi:hypothetical protein
MTHSQFLLEDSHLEFLNQFQRYGFKTQDELIRAALSHLQMELELRQLQESAALYAEVYEGDRELQELTEAAVVEWAE